MQEIMCLFLGSHEPIAQCTSRLAAQTISSSRRQHSSGRSGLITSRQPKTPCRAVATKTRGARRRHPSGTFGIPSAPTPGKRVAWTSPVHRPRRLHAAAIRSRSSWLARHGLLRVAKRAITRSCQGYCEIAATCTDRLAARTICITGQQITGGTL